MRKFIFTLMFIVSMSLNPIAGQTDEIWFLSWSNNQTLLAIVKVDGEIVFFDALNNQIISSTVSTNSPITIVWSPDNQRIAGNYSDNMVRVWDVNSGILLREFEMHDVIGMIWSPNNRLYISTIESGMSIRNMDTYAFEGSLGISAYSLSFSPNGRYLAAGGWGGSSIYDILTDDYFAIQSSIGIVNSIMWNTNGTRVASLDSLGNFGVWDLATNQLETSFQMPSGVLMWWEDNHLYIANDDVINIWDTTVWQIISSVPLELGFFVARNSTGDLYAEFSGTEFEISTYCEIIPSGDALALSNAILDGNSIQFHKQICLTENATYTLTASLPDITGDITFIGNGAQIVMTGDSRIFNVTATGGLHLKNVTLSGGVADDGGAIFNAGDLTLENVTLENNSAVRGGAIYNAGNLVMNGGAIQNNTASEFGGGIYNLGDMQLDGVNIRENTAPEGSGVYQGE